jgi:hypothetical protein
LKNAAETTKKSNFRSLTKGKNTVETVSKAIIVRVQLIIEITHWRQKNLERTGKFAQQNDRAIHDDNEHGIPEEGSGIVHEKTRLAFRCSLIDNQLKENWSSAV